MAGSRVSAAISTVWWANQNRLSGSLPTRDASPAATALSIDAANTGPIRLPTLSYSSRANSPSSRWLVVMSRSRDAFGRGSGKAVAGKAALGGAQYQLPPEVTGHA